MSESDTIQFRSKSIKQVLDTLKEIRVGGLNESEVGREAMKQLIPEILSEEEKKEMYKMYERGELSEESIEIALGKEFDDIKSSIEDTEEMANEDTSKYLVE